MIYQFRIPSDSDDREKSYAFERARRQFTEKLYDFLMQHKRGVVEIESNIQHEGAPRKDDFYLDWGLGSGYDVIEFRLKYTEVAYRHVTFPVLDDNPQCQKGRGAFRRMIEALKACLR